MQKVKWSSFLPLLALTSISGLLACGDDGGPTGVEEPEKPSAVQVRISNLSFASATELSSVGNLIVAQGVEAGPVDIVFLDDIGNPVNHGELEYLDVIMADEAIATWRAAQENDFSGFVQGRAIGNTSVVFRLMFGKTGNAKAIFTSAPITVVISE